MKGQVRTCVSCHQKAKKSTFIRIVRTPAGNIKIGESTSQGRGMYLCKKKDCILHAFHRKGKNAVQYHLRKKSKTIFQSASEKDIEKELLRIVQS